MQAHLHDICCQVIDLPIGDMSEYTDALTLDIMGFRPWTGARHKGISDFDPGLGLDIKGFRSVHKGI